MANKKNEAKVKFSMETAEAREQTKKAANEIKVLRSELRLSAEEMKTNGTSLEGLQKQYRLLEDETKQYETKLDAINTQIEKATEIYGENSDEVARLKLNYNNTATTLDSSWQRQRKPWMNSGHPCSRLMMLWKIPETAMKSWKIQCRDNETKWNVYSQNIKILRWKWEAHRMKPKI